MRITRSDPRRPQTPLRKIICYYQTHFLDGKFVPIQRLLTENTGVTHVILAAIHLNEPPGNITLNDDPYSAPMNDILWKDVRKLQEGGVKVLGMLGGAHKGSFTALDGDRASFEKYYEPLREMITWCCLDGLDLDVEEEMSLAGIIRLIDRLKIDFGDEFIITLAPVATALQRKGHISGFDYEALEKAFGDRISWYNTQFYCGWGSMENTKDFEEIMSCGWPPDKVVVGVVTNPANCRGFVPNNVLCETLTTLLKKYPTFAGVDGWEYFNSLSTDSSEGPWSWARLMSKILHSENITHQTTAGSSENQSSLKGK